MADSTFKSTFYLKYKLAGIQAADYHGKGKEKKYNRERAKSEGSSLF